MNVFQEEIFSDGYLEAFYKAHVAASRRSSLDEDIAAIEAEIRKVEQVRHRVQSYRVTSTNQHLNSCGNSECSDDEDTENVTRDVHSTSIFRVYNSTMPVKKPRPKGPDVFSWALHQVVNLDHNYCGHSQQEAVTTLDHDNLALNSVLWHQFTAAKRSLVLRKLYTILRYSPTTTRNSPSHSPHSPTPSLSLLPHGLAETLKNQGGLGTTPTARSLSKQHLQVDNSNVSPAGFGNKLVIKSTTPTTPSSIHSNNRQRKKPRHSPYDKRIVLTSRRRNVSTCSEGDDHIEID